MHCHPSKHSCTAIRALERLWHGASCCCPALPCLCLPGWGASSLTLTPNVDNVPHTTLHCCPLQHSSHLCRTCTATPLSLHSCHRSTAALPQNPCTIVAWRFLLLPSPAWLMSPCSPATSQLLPLRECHMWTATPPSTTHTLARAAWPRVPSAILRQSLFFLNTTTLPSSSARVGPGRMSERSTRRRRRRPLLSVGAATAAASAMSIRSSGRCAKIARCSNESLRLVEGWAAGSPSRLHSKASSVSISSQGTRNRQGTLRVPAQPFLKKSLSTRRTCWPGVPVR
mmetsp:Transcript_19015/g.53236  ORF Transcript_19015/g.53236 Transcript_19015/m.53236 type:complete len:284 (+) Transcript_19015:186-1037(+)